MLTLVMKSSGIKKQKLFSVRRNQNVPALTEVLIQVLLTETVILSLPGINTRLPSYDNVQVQFVPTSQTIFSVHSSTAVEPRN